MLQMKISTTDITYKWGENINELDRQYAKWRQALFQDVQESSDGKFLYFLYDPQADQKCLTTGARKGDPGLTIFDTEYCCFTGQVVLRHPGSLKFLFSLKCPSPQGGSSLILVTDEFNHNYKQNQLHIFRLDMTVDGRQVAATHHLLTAPIPIVGDYICSLREDAPEIIVLASPGLQVYRVDCMVKFPTEPVYYPVPIAELNHFYDGFLHNEKVCLLSAHPDGYLDWSRVHILDLKNPTSIITYMCSPDPETNSYPAPRKECAMDALRKGIIFAGGEIVSGEQYGEVTRLRDYWMLDLSLLQWKILPDEMPCDLIEPRLTVSNSGNIYLWGDYDVADPKIMTLPGTHIRIFKIAGIEEPRNYYATNSPFIEQKAYSASNPGSRKASLAENIPLKEEIYPEVYIKTVYDAPKKKKKSQCCTIM